MFYSSGQRKQKRKQKPDVTNDFLKLYLRGQLAM